VNGVCIEEIFGACWRGYGLFTGLGGNGERKKGGKYMLE
jgi:hypothetical protein